jgi:threonine/homoserine/homoserine lactone efflux protein
VVLIPGTGVVYTVSGSVGGGRLAVFAVYASAAIRDLVLAAPVARRWIERAFGAILIGFVARLAFTER